MSRVYPPLPENHPAVGLHCANCGSPFRAGDTTTMRVKRESIPPPGSRLPGELTIAGELIHEDCNKAAGRG